MILSIGLYIKTWETRQPMLELNDVVVEKILPYHRGGGDLHWSLKGYRIYIEDDPRPIDFPLKNWEDSIQVNDRISLRVRASFFNNELDGLVVIKSMNTAF